MLQAGGALSSAQEEPHSPWATRCTCKRCLRSVSLVLALKDSGWAAREQKDSTPKQSPRERGQRSCEPRPARGQQV